MKKVKYKDFDDAVQLCILHGPACYAGKSDMSAAFRHFAILPKFWKYLVMKAQSPIDNKFYYFVDKCMPFGAAISCSHFQRFSNAISHIAKIKSGNHDNINYLDDFFFVALLKYVCNRDIQTFIDICSKIRFPIFFEKTEWATQIITFLGLLINTKDQCIGIPTEKLERAKKMVSKLLDQKKTTLHEMQRLTGFLNFLCKAILPGRAFLCRLYAHTAGITKSHHHLNLNLEIKADLKVWDEFLKQPMAYCRKFIDMNKRFTSDIIEWYTDASANPDLGAGGYSESDWFILQWEQDFIINQRPSINYLELYAVTISVFLWIQKISEQKNNTFL